MPKHPCNHDYEISDRKALARVLSFSIEGVTGDPQDAGPMEIECHVEVMKIRWIGELEWHTLAWWEIATAIAGEPSIDVRQVIKDKTEQGYSEGLGEGIEEGFRQGLEHFRELVRMSKTKREYRNLSIDQLFILIEGKVDEMIAKEKKKNRPKVTAMKKQDANGTAKS